MRIPALAPLLVLLCISASAQTNGATPWKVVQLDIKEWVSCAVLEGGYVKCWGFEPGPGASNALGQGDGQARGGQLEGMGDKLKPIKLRAPVTQVATGSHHVCFLFDSGSVSCVGSFDAPDAAYSYESRKNYGGTPDTLGDGLPLVNLGTGKTATYLESGWHHMCAILNDGSLRCWGKNNQGQLGLGDFNDRGDAPGEMGDGLPEVPLPAGRRVVNVSAGQDHTCILLDDQSIRCFGLNNAGQLGIGSVEGSWGGYPDQVGDGLPVVDVGGPVAQVSAGGNVTCVLLVDGAVKCFGNQDMLQLGTSDVAADPVGRAPQDMGANLKSVLSPGSQVVQVSAGRPNTCVRFADGRVQCWGINGSGQLGVGDLSSRWAGNLTVALLRSPVAHISARGWCRVCGLLVNGSVQCWGLNDNGALGIGTARSMGGEPRDMTALPIVDLGTALPPGTPFPTVAPAAAPALAPVGSPTLAPVAFPTPVPVVPGSASITPAVAQPIAMDTKVQVPIGAIVGGVVGGLVLLAVGIFVAILLVRRRSKANGQHKSRAYPPLPPGPDTVPLNPDKAPASSQKALSAAAQNDYEWVLLPELESKGPRPRLQAGINDVDLDTAKEWIAGSGWNSPVQVLSSEEVKQQIKLVAGKPLGTGACGQVFICAWESRFPGALLAAKVMQNEHPDVLKSFAYEAQLLATIRHPNIVRTYGYCLQQPHVCIVMELLQGSVDDVLRTVISGAQSSTGGKTGFTSAHSSVAPSSTGLNSTSQTNVTSSTGGLAGLPQHGDAVAHVALQMPQSKQSTLMNAPSAFSAISLGSATPSQQPPSMLSMTEVLRISLDVAYGLEFLHEMHVPTSIRMAELDGPISEEAEDVGSGGQSGGVLHRDLKPANILLNMTKQAKICDFGIARRVQATALHTEVEWAGTASYMAPELLAVRTNKGMRGMVTRKVDIYSLAIIMNELLCHSRAWLRPDQVTGGVRPLLPTSDDPDTQWRAECLARLQCSPQVLDKLIVLIQACWHHRLEKRPAAPEVRLRLTELKQEHDTSG